MRLQVISLILIVTLAACSSAPAPNFLSSQRGENGAVTGKAGTGWSDEELRSNSFGSVCDPSETITDLVITRTNDGTATFSATCVS